MMKNFSYLPLPKLDGTIGTAIGLVHTSKLPHVLADQEARFRFSRNVASRMSYNDFEADLQQALCNHKQAGLTGAVKIFTKEVIWMRQQAQDLQMVLR